MLVRFKSFLLFPDAFILNMYNRRLFPTCPD